MPQSARLSAGGGVQWLFGQCPNEQRFFYSGASLIHLNQLNTSSSGGICKVCSYGQPGRKKTVFPEIVRLYIVVDLNIGYGKHINANITESVPSYDSSSSVSGGINSRQMARPSN